jgi:MFS family permease
VLATEISDPAITGTAVGVVSTVAWFGLASGPVLFGVVTDLFGYYYAWMCLAAFCSVAFILCIFLPGRKAFKHVEGAFE